MNKYAQNYCFATLILCETKHNRGYALLYLFFSDFMQIDFIVELLVYS